MGNILLTTLGSSWQIVPELFGFTNPESLPLYRKSTHWASLSRLREENDIFPIGEIWIVTTDGETANVSLQALDRWRKSLADPPVFRVWQLQGIRDMTSQTECEKMAELILRVALLAKEEIGGAGSRFLSLSGGFKTMSADMQWAAFVFGCDALLHIISQSVMSPSQKEALNRFAMDSPLPQEIAEVLTLVVALRRLEESITAQVAPAIGSDRFPIPKNGGKVVLEACLLREEILERQRRAGFLWAQNRTRELSGNFPLLATLSPAVVRWLKEVRIGTDPDLDVRLLPWVRSLPKAELHCHMGGILSPEDMIIIAEEVLSTQADPSRFSEPIDRFRKQSGEDCSARAIRQAFSQIEEPLAVCSCLAAFVGRAADLEREIYGSLTDPLQYRGIGIDSYERLGDFQGSGLLQCPTAIRAVCRILQEKCRQQNIRYCELRCSPVNYTRGELTEERVVEILREELLSDAFTCFRLILIASRHGKMSEAWKQVELLESLLRKEKSGNRLIVGFDLAGNEEKRRPSEMQDLFLPIRRHCLNITVHAGETADPENIWEAVYTLSADRIGHGLTLAEPGTEELRKRFLDRQIAIEMCPSSNYQIVGYDDHHLGISDGKEYPLGLYLREGLRCTINTDNPGISRTDLTQEYFKAASMTPGGLTLLQVLQLIRNGFLAAFCSHEERNRLMDEAEQSLLQLIEKTYDEFTNHPGSRT